MLQLEYVYKFIMLFFLLVYEFYKNLLLTDLQSSFELNSDIHGMLLSKTTLLLIMIVRIMFQKVTFITFLNLKGY